MECEYLKRSFGSLTEQNNRLHIEVEELRVMKVGSSTMTSASSLTMHVSSLRASYHRSDPLYGCGGRSSRENDSAARARALIYVFLLLVLDMV
uniref:Leucine zipper homeobox-associated domain-containing protein n=1 Tax=Brassica oleracea var. oleracea TaxID=109376 RepID=A0A0D3E7D4_BRAOL